MKGTAGAIKLLCIKLPAICSVQGRRLTSRFIEARFGDPISPKAVSAPGQARVLDSLSCSRSVLTVEAGTVHSAVHEHSSILCPTGFLKDGRQKSYIGASVVIFEQFIPLSIFPMLTAY